MSKLFTALLGTAENSENNEAIWKNSKTVPLRKGSHEFEDPDEGIICFPTNKRVSETSILW